MCRSFFCKVYDYPVAKLIFLLTICDLFMQSNYLFRTSVDQPEGMLDRPHKHRNVALVMDKAPRLGIVIQ